MYLCSVASTKAYQTRKRQNLTSFGDTRLFTAPARNAKPRHWVSIVEFQRRWRRVVLRKWRQAWISSNLDGLPFKNKLILQVQKDKFSRSKLYNTRQYKHFSNKISVWVIVMIRQFWWKESSDLCASHPPSKHVDKSGNLLVVGSRCIKKILKPELVRT